MKNADRSFQAFNVRGEMTKRRNVAGKVMDACGEWMARPTVFFILLGGHVAWIILNLVPGLAWDPPPFAVLAMIASVEAPFLTLIILMRQNRDERIAELRQEVLLHVVCQLDRRLSRLTQQEPLEARSLVNLIRCELERDEGPIEGEQED